MNNQSIDQIFSNFYYLEPIASDNWTYLNLLPAGLHS